MLVLPLPADSLVVSLLLQWFTKGCNRVADGLRLCGTSNREPWPGAVLAV